MSERLSERLLYIVVYWCILYIVYCILLYIDNRHHLPIWFPHHEENITKGLTVNTSSAFYQNHYLFIFVIATVSPPPRSSNFVNQSELKRHQQSTHNSRLPRWDKNVLPSTKMMIMTMQFARIKKISKWISPRECRLWLMLSQTNWVFGEWATFSAHW